MKRKITEEEVVENLLSQYPIKERQDQRQNNALVATLINGEKRLVELEKTIVPAEVVGHYHVVEHDSSNSGIPWPIGFYDNYAQARKLYDEKAEGATKNGIDEGDAIKILLVGEFKGQYLDMDEKGVLDANTGITLCSTVVTHNRPIEKLYVDPMLPVTVTNKLYVELDRKMATLTFEHRFFPSVKLNAEFWKIDPEKGISREQRQSSGKDDDKLLHKRKANDMSTELWVDPLLAKRSEGKSQGKGMN